MLQTTVVMMNGQPMTVLLAGGAPTAAAAPKQGMPQQQSQYGQQPQVRRGGFYMLNYAK